jgi:hypothetical protein
MAPLGWLVGMPHLPTNMSTNIGSTRVVFGKNPPLRSNTETKRPLPKRCGQAALLGVGD